MSNLFQFSIQRYIVILMETMKNKKNIQIIIKNMLSSITSVFLFLFPYERNLHTRKYKHRRTSGYFVFFFCSFLRNSWYLIFRSSENVRILHWDKYRTGLFYSSINWNLNRLATLEGRLEISKALKRLEIVYNYR